MRESGHVGLQVALRVESQPVKGKSNNRDALAPQEPSNAIADSAGSSLQPEDWPSDSASPWIKGRVLADAGATFGLVGVLAPSD